ncbi:MAG: adenosine kinase [Patescibacteria group bacterium]|nr:adenosine kinase [Patescibacteria group bacterium]
MSKKSKILVCGSVVIDIISKKKFYGGTAGNIAYGLGQMKARPLLFSLVGKDFNKEYGPHLAKNGVDLQVRTDKKMNTANFSYSILEKGSSNEIWEPNAYVNINKLSILETVDIKKLKDVSIAIFAPGNPESTYNHLLEFKNFAPKAQIIFDPGQMINYYSKQQFISCMNLADILILNNNEYGKISKILDKDLVKFFTNSNKTIIKTSGANGSNIYNKSKITNINAPKPKQVLDAMGAGDAYRAGMIYKLWQGKSITAACKFGATIASINVEYIGCQSYKIQKKLL